MTKLVAKRAFCAKAGYRLATSQLAEKASAMLSRFFLASVVLLVLAGGASAQDNEGFRSPTGNIHCLFFRIDGQASLRCDIQQITNRLPQPPANCDLDWGTAFAMDADSRRAERICHGDTVVGRYPILAYGQIWSRSGFMCRSSQTGMSCRNRGGAGFDLSRSSQKLY